MPKLFVVGAQKTLAELAPALLRSRIPARVRDSALDAIRRANPGLDLDRITPGTVVLVPEVEGLRPALRETGPVDQVADDLVSQVRDGLEALVAAADAAEEARAAEKRDSQELLASSLVQRLSAQSAELAANVDSVRATHKRDDVDGRRQLAQLHEAAQEWGADLETLRSLLP
jgi:hypothetical protein